MLTSAQNSVKLELIIEIINQWFIGKKHNFRKIKKKNFKVNNNIKY